MRALLISLLACSTAAATPLYLSNKELHCLALMVYHEARSESMVCQVIAAQTVINRMGYKWWPSEACQVVHQPSQYSFLKEAPTLEMLDESSKKRAAQAVYYALNSPFDLSEGSTHFVKEGTWTYWQTHPNVTFKGQCDKHVFFREER